MLSPPVLTVGGPVECAHWCHSVVPLSSHIQQCTCYVHQAGEMCISHLHSPSLCVFLVVFAFVYVWVCICVWVCLCECVGLSVCGCLFTSNAQTNFLSIKASASRFQSVYLKKNNFSHSQQEQGLFLIFLAFLDRWTLSCGSSSPPVSMRSMTS